MLGETIGAIDITASSVTGNLISRIININGNTVTDNASVVITHIHLISGASPSVLTVANGLGGNVRIDITGTASKGIDFDFGVWGITFPAGAYVTYDSNQTGGAIVCKASKI